MPMSDAGLKSRFEQVIGIDWTRDPFDRMIVGHAAINHDVLVSKDDQVRANYPNASW